MSLFGTIIKIENNKAKILAVQGKSCEGCNACKGLFKRDTSEPIEIEADIPLEFKGLSENDTVEVELNPKDKIQLSTLVFGSPLIGFFIGLLLAPKISEIMSWQNYSDAIQIISAFLGMIVGFAITNIVSKKICNLSDSFYIVSYEKADSSGS